MRKRALLIRLAGLGVMAGMAVSAVACTLDTSGTHAFARGAIGNAKIGYSKASDSSLHHAYQFTAYCDHGAFQVSASYNEATGQASEQV